MTEYGIFNNDGCLRQDLWTIVEAESALRGYIELGEDEEGGLSIEELCPDHNAEPKHGCGECSYLDTDWATDDMGWNKD